MNKFLSIILFCSTTLIFSGLSYRSSAQLAAHTAGFQKWCKATTLNPGPHLGGSPSATGGVPPYHYHWSCLTMIPLPMTPMFDNDTIADPQIQPWDFGFSMYMDVVLTVTDNTGAVAYDTAHIHASGFAYATNDCERYKGATDTLKLVPLIIGGSYGCPPYTYAWSPNLYLSDSSVAYPECWAPVNMTYTLVYSDSLGCSDAPAPCHVYIVPVSASMIQGSSSNVNIYPVPLSEGSLISIARDQVGSTLYFFAADGRLVKSIVLMKQSTELGKTYYDLPPGLICYKVLTTDGQILANGKLVK